MEFKSVCLLFSPSVSCWSVGVTQAACLFFFFPWGTSQGFIFSVKLVGPLGKYGTTGLWLAHLPEVSSECSLVVLALVWNSGMFLHPKLFLPEHDQLLSPCVIFLGWTVNFLVPEPFQTPRHIIVITLCICGSQRMTCRKETDRLSQNTVYSPIAPSNDFSLVWLVQLTLSC